MDNIFIDETSTEISEYKFITFKVMNIYSLISVFFPSGVLIDIALRSQQEGEGHDDASFA